MNHINEELKYMKYLFGYKKGVVISEQASAEVDPLATIENEPAKPDSSTNKPQTPSEPNAQDLEKQRAELEQKLSVINSNLEKLASSKDAEIKTDYKKEILSEIEYLNKFLDQSCAKRMTRLCRERLKRKKELDAKLTQLRDLSVKEFQQDFDSGEPEQSVVDKTNAWVGVASSLLALFTGIGAMFKKDESSSEF